MGGKAQCVQFYNRAPSRDKNPTDAPSRRPDYAQGIQEHSILPTLHDKLRLGLFSPGKQNKRICTQIHSSQYKSSAHGQEPQNQRQKHRRHTESYELKNALIDESRTAGDTGILGRLVPRLLVHTA